MDGLRSDDNVLNIKKDKKGVEWKNNWMNIHISVGIHGIHSLYSLDVKSWYSWDK